MKKFRSFAEYILAFLKPEAIKRVLERREQEEYREDGEVEEIFKQQVANTFGRPL